MLQYKKSTIIMKAQMVMYLGARDNYSIIISVALYNENTELIYIQGKN